MEKEVLVKGDAEMLVRILFTVLHIGYFEDENPAMDDFRSDGPIPNVAGRFLDHAPFPLDVCDVSSKCPHCGHPPASRVFDVSSCFSGPAQMHFSAFLRIKYEEHGQDAEVIDARCGMRIRHLRHRYAAEVTDVKVGSDNCTVALKPRVMEQAVQAFIRGDRLPGHLLETLRPLWA